MAPPFLTIGPVVVYENINLSLKLILKKSNIYSKWGFQIIIINKFITLTAILFIKI